MRLYGTIAAIIIVLCLATAAWADDDDTVWTGDDRANDPRIQQFEELCYNCFMIFMEERELYCPISDLVDLNDDCYFLAVLSYLECYYANVECDEDGLADMSACKGNLNDEMDACDDPDGEEDEDTGDPCGCSTTQSQPGWWLSGLLFLIGGAVIWLGSRKKRHPRS